MCPTRFTLHPGQHFLPMMTCSSLPNLMIPDGRTQSLVNGVKNTRPVTGGRTVTINGFELGYENKDDVVVQVVLQGTIPSGTAQGTNKTLVRIQELDARGYSIAYTAVNIDRLIGEPTPPPTLAYGSITVTSSPSGADIYIDNVYKGLSPAVFGNIPNGNHLVLMKRDGYQDLTKSVTVTANNQTVYAVLNQQTSSPVTITFTGPDTIRWRRIPDTNSSCTDPRLWFALHYYITCRGTCVRGWCDDGSNPGHNSHAFRRTSYRYPDYGWLPGSQNNHYHQ